MSKLKKFVATLAAVATVGALSVGAFASYTYGSIFKQVRPLIWVPTPIQVMILELTTYMLRHPLGLIITLNCMWTVDSLESIISTVHQ